MESLRLNRRMMGVAVGGTLLAAWVWIAGQTPPAQGMAGLKSPAGSVAPARPAFPELPPTPPDWEFVQKMAFSRFPGVNAHDVLRLAADCCPHRIRVLRELSAIHPDEAVERFTDLIYELHGILALHKSNPRLYDCRLRELKIESAVTRWAEASRHDTGEGQARALESLRQVLGEAFDIRQELMTIEVETLEKKLAELKRLVRQRAEQRTAIIQHRLEALTRGEKTPSW